MTKILFCDLSHGCKKKNIRDLSHGCYKCMVFLEGVRSTSHGQGYIDIFSTSVTQAMYVINVGCFEGVRSISHGEEYLGHFVGRALETVGWQM
jgi:hypothetical protein